MKTQRQRRSDSPVRRFSSHAGRTSDMFRQIIIGLVLVVASTTTLLAQTSWTTGTFSYDAAGNITAMGSNVFFYDTAGRLVHGTAEGTGNVQEYTYDGFGNRLAATTTGLNCAGNVACGGTVAVDTNNHITTPGFTYDTAGNTKTMAGSTYEYDGAGMMSSLVAPNTWRYDYIYTAEDERIATYTGNGNWQFTLRGLDGKVLREMTYQGTTWAWIRDHVWRDGQLLATVSPSGTEQFHLDHLGTPRVVTDASGNKIGYHAYYPFGEELNLGSDENPLERLKFTGHERDTVLGSSLDYMHARYSGMNMGRFLSVDPKLGVKDRPQSWNRYAYVHNNPLNAIDPDGEDEYFVFRAAAKSSDAKWLTVQREAKKYGNTVTIYNGQRASQENYINALGTLDAHIVDSGHTVLYAGADGGITAGSVELANGSVGIAADKTLPVPVSNADVQADTVAIFGCSSIGLSGQYLATTFFTGVGSGPDAVSSIKALDAAAQAYTSVMVKGGSVNAATDAASAALKKSTDPVDKGDTAETVPTSPPL